MKLDTFLKGAIAIAVALNIVLLALPYYWDSQYDDVDREIHRQAWEHARANVLGKIFN